MVPSPEVLPPPPSLSRSIHLPAVLACPGMEWGGLSVPRWLSGRSRRPGSRWQGLKRCIPRWLRGDGSTPRTPQVWADAGREQDCRRSILVRLPRCTGDPAATTPTPTTITSNRHGCSRAPGALSKSKEFGHGAEGRQVLYGRAVTERPWKLSLSGSAFTE